MPTNGDVLTWNDTLDSNQEYAAPTGGGGSAAEDITFTPAGTIAATDVQAAIEEVAAEVGGGGGGGYTAADYATPVTSNVSITATTQAGATTLITSNTVACDGTSRYKIEFACVGFTMPSGGQPLVLNLFVDGAVVSVFAFLDDSAAAVAQIGPSHPWTTIVPSAGNHTFSIRAHCGSGGSATANAGAGTAGANSPLELLITKLA